MELTKFSDYSIRALIYLGIHSDRLVSISEIAGAYGISRNHLTKIINHLANLAIVDTARGRGGGIRLAKEPEEIVIGSVIRGTEPHFNILECFDPENNSCRIESCCTLKPVLKKALEAFFFELDKHTLADIIANKRGLKALLSV